MRHAQRRLAEWFEKAGIAGKTAHSLRHSFATGLLARTGDLRLVQAALNHASIVSTTIYVGVDQAKLRAAVGSWMENRMASSDDSLANSCQAQVGTTKKSPSRQSKRWPSITE